MDSNIKKRIRDKAPRLPNWDMDMLIEAVAEEYDSDSTFCSGILTFIEELASDCDPKRIRSDFKQKTCVTLTRKEVAAMLANAFLCRVPCLDLKQPKIGINFHGLFSNYQLSEEKKSSRREKIKCILRYFNVINSTANKLEGEVTYKRRSLHKFPSIDEEATTTLTAFKVQEDRSLSDATGMPQVLFAKKRFGASALGNGYLQEDIKLVTCPELLLAKLFPGELRDNEAIIVTGAHAYVKTTGRASSFVVEDVVLDLKRSDSSPIIAIDATDFGGDRNRNDQYTRAAVEREWKKAYVGFSAVDSEYNTIATGNWGCGVSKGDPEWKMKIQWLAASLAGKNLDFYTFSNERLAQTAHRVERDWRGRSIVELFCALMEGNRASPPMQQPAPEVPRNSRLPTRASGSDSRAETSNNGFAVPHQNPRREQELPMGNLHYSTEDSVPFGFAVTSRGPPEQPCHSVGPKQE